MKEFTTDALEAWENEGGAPINAKSVSVRIGLVGVKNTIAGTVNQVAWAAQIKEQVNKEFDRVANALNSAASKHVGQDQTDTHAVIAILEDKRSEVMANEEAGFFIHDWQELHDQVRQIIVQDPRYQAIKTKQEMRRRVRKPENSA